MALYCCRRPGVHRISRCFPLLGCQFCSLFSADGDGRTRIPLHIAACTIVSLPRRSQDTTTFGAPVTRKVRDYRAPPRSVNDYRTSIHPGSFSHNNAILVVFVFTGTCK
ncbi:hypothetical protein L1987_31879 [Smallanthus sonchifolius]|uniref:Uncharacterized protein n=1 Tax=Smallanthus sonchifolius TaxID=185202 RepID=A0ACB9I810_9ASTR|nr:hypothetical protein L1987_31879 [Smallanthus sonchifolius]